jgi:hypothetical protein
MVDHHSSEGTHHKQAFMDGRKCKHWWPFFWWGKNQDGSEGCAVWVAVVCEMHRMFDVRMNCPNVMGNLVWDL